MTERPGFDFRGRPLPPDIDWDRPEDWGGRVHVASDYGPGIEEADEQ